MVTFSCLIRFLSISSMVKNIMLVWDFLAFSQKKILSVQIRYGFTLPWPSQSLLDRLLLPKALYRNLSKRSSHQRGNCDRLSWYRRCLPYRTHHWSLLQFLLLWYPRVTTPNISSHIPSTTIAMDFSAETQSIGRPISYSLAQRRFRRALSNRNPLHPDMVFGKSLA